MSVPVTALSQDERRQALLEITGDLDKADVLDQRLPAWLLKADANWIKEVQRAHRQLQPYDARVRKMLQTIESLETYCARLLTQILKETFSVDLDVFHDTLWLERTEHILDHSKVPALWIARPRTEKLGLLQAALRNFSSEQAQGKDFGPASSIRHGNDGAIVKTVSAADFATCCRKLDLGQRYQDYLADIINLSVPVKDEWVSNPDADNLRGLRLHELRIEAHLAWLKNDIGLDAHRMLLELTSMASTVGPTDVADILFEGKPLVWEQIELLDTCIWGALVLSAGQPEGKCLVYMPNDAHRVLYEYPSLAEFKIYLELKLQVPASAKLFERHLDESSRAAFFNRFAATRKLERIKTLPVEAGIFQFFFNSFIGKLQIDARTLAVPTRDFDAEQQRKSDEKVFETALTVANIAGFFVPVIGQLMMGVGIGQLLGEVYEGGQDWRSGEKTEALAHLFSVVENLASMAVFALGARVVHAVGNTELPAGEFFEGFETVKSPDGRSRLWKPNLRAYRLPAGHAEGATQVTPGEHRADTTYVLNHDDRLYSARFDEETERWQITHPGSESHYQIPVEHNGRAWKHIHEHPGQWSDPAYAVRRIEPGLATLRDEQLEQICALTRTSLSSLQQLAEGNRRLPMRFVDMAQRYVLEQKIRDLIWQMEQVDFARADNADLLLHALPDLPGWPQKRFFKVFDDEDELIARYPEPPLLDEGNLSVHVTRKQLQAGTLLQTVADGIYDSELTRLLGESAAGRQEDQLLARRIAVLLKEDAKPLFKRLYTAHDQALQPRQILLKEHFPDVPTRMLEELSAELNSVDLSHLDDTRRMPLRLTQRVREVHAEIAVDRAISGLHLPALADERTRTLALGLLGRLPEWPESLQLEVRLNNRDGALVDQVGKITATDRRMVFQSADGYQAQGLDDQVRPVVLRGPHGFYQAIIQALSSSEREVLGIAGEEVGDAERLQLRLAARSSNRAECERILTPHATEAPTQDLSCMLADAPAEAPVSHPRGLVRKLKKLYPWFTDVEVNRCLSALGSNHFERAKALKLRERSLQSLREQLKRWRNDETQMKKLPGWPGRYKAARLRVAEQLELCWRQQTSLPGELGVPVSGLRLDGMRVGNLPVFSADVDFSHVRRLSLQNMQLGDDVAYFLKAFKGLEKLELDANRISRLPEVLSHMPALRYLSLHKNALNLTAQTAQKLAHMRTLHTLDLSDNPLLDTPDVSRMNALRTLNLRNTRASDLPQGLLTLLQLEEVNLRENDIRTLPGELFDAPIALTETINLRLNPLTAQSQLDLNVYRSRTGVGMGFLEDEVGMLSDQRAREVWLAADTVDGYMKRSITWQALKDDWRSGDFFKVFYQLVHSRDNRLVHAEMTRRVWAVLEAAEADFELRGLLFSLAEGEPNCVDAAAFTFSEMEVTVLIDQALRQSGLSGPDDKLLIELARGLFRLDRLDGFADRFSDRHNVVDRLGVRLAFRKGLADTLALPGQPKNITYTQVGGVTEDDLKDALAEVTTKEMSQALKGFVVRQNFWRKHLKRHFAQDFTAASDPLVAQLDALVTDSATYQHDVQTLQTRYRQAREDVFERLTQEALERLDVPASGQCSVR
ncbi:NEL-type E3 ubiquitin ligase domain-containing protein [Pseudomonas atagonensis]|uniref:NEL-type E3 ubiquitin ligase domain-containing protein n=1 Tax=Pseudomonas atagonensis TaxID=2609964 RepID=UPI00140DF5A1|nr:NEL-type E3 ubiquitin ligase domain-containing protein [Pseudomonas atagonensis]